MKKFISLTATLALLFVSGATPAFAATANATSVESYTQGLTKGGAAIDPSRDNPNEALGAPDGAFVSLGYGGELILGFNQNMSGSLALSVFETTFSNYPEETANVFVSENAGGPWTSVGTASNENGLEDGKTIFAVGQCFQYVRILDTTDSGPHNNSSDGFDVDAVESEFSENCPPPAHGDDTVENDNEATVYNEVVALANTGGNGAGGSEGGNGGRGGDIRNNGDDVDDSSTGNGGNGGSGDVGGTIYTGNANANAGVINDVNSNDTEINRCACNGTEDGDVVVMNRNRAMVGNGVYAGANTGENGADGSSGGEGGNGGDIDNNGDDVDDSTTGSGGTGGSGSLGALIQTGHANSNAGVINVVNRNVTRILR